ncbi:thioesterase domain-containing protein [Catenulispora rubra]|uniref:thioesterase domain-containing protein n=1 Tax=Catenulispora rubra TaxID=280293 RepID=UPI0018928193|nr:thioesterase domain-containing protein [Catenulispora rubra]
MAEDAGVRSHIVLTRSTDRDREPLTTAWIGGIFGGVKYLRPLARATRMPGISYGLCPAFGTATGEARIDAFVDSCLAALRRVQPRGPYRIVGHSFGGTIAYGVGCRLRDQGEQVKVVILDSSLYQLPPEEPASPMREQQELRALDLLLYGTAVAYAKPMPRDIDWTQPASRIRPQVHAALGEIGLHLAPDRLDAVISTCTRNIGALAVHRPPDADFPVLFVQSDEFPDLPSGQWRFMRTADRFAKWRTVKISDLTIAEVSGDHLTMTAFPHVIDVGNVIRTFLAGDARRGRPPLQLSSR